MRSCLDIDFDPKYYIEKYISSSNPRILKWYPFIIIIYFLFFGNHTLRAVGFSCASRERNHCKQPFDFPSGMRDYVPSHLMYLCGINYTILETNNTISVGRIPHKAV